MPGMIGVIVRKPDGAIVPMRRHAKILPYYLSHAALVSGQLEAWLDAFQDAWLKRKAEYEGRKHGKRVTRGDIDDHFPHDAMVPYGAGLVVIDMPTRSVLHAQDYCTPGVIKLYEVHDPDPRVRDNVATLHQLGHLSALRLLPLVPRDPKAALRGPSDLRQQSFEVSLGTVTPQQVHAACSETSYHGVFAGPAGPYNPIGIHGSGPGVNMVSGGSSPAAHPGGHITFPWTITFGDLLARLGLPAPESMTASMLGQRASSSNVHLSIGRTEWSFQAFDASPRGLITLKERLNALNYSFSADDDRLWQTYIGALRNEEYLDDPQSRRRLEQDLATRLRAATGRHRTAAEAVTTRRGASGPRAA